MATVSKVVMAGYGTVGVMALVVITAIVPKPT
jgi:hypothetical protein